MVDRHTLKSSSNVWSRDLFLLFTVLITKKPASQRYDVERGRSAPIASFVIMGYSSLRDNQNEVISVDKCFSFSPLSFLISVSSSSSETVNFADPQAFIVNGSLTQSRKIHQVMENTFQRFYSAATEFVELNRQNLRPVCNLLSIETFQLCSLF